MRGALVTAVAEAMRGEEGFVRGTAAFVALRPQPLDYAEEENGTTTRRDGEGGETRQGTTSTMVANEAERVGSLL
jgi:hypothetical protein